MTDARDKTAPLPAWAQVADVVGFAGMLALGGLVVAAFFPGMRTVSPAILVGKNAVLSILGGACCLCAGVMLWTREASRYRAVAPAAAMLGGLALVWLASAGASDVPAHSLRSGMPRLLALLAGISAPMFVRTPGRLRVLLCAVAAGGIFVAVTCLLSFAGWRGFNRLAYGIDPRDVLDDAALAEAVGRGALSEGLGRSPMRSSMGNSEYVGGFLAAMAVLMLVPGGLLLWRGSRRWGMSACACGVVCAAALVLAQTRSAFIALGVGLGAALLALLPARGVLIAAAIAAASVCGAAIGPVAGIAVGLAGLAAVLVDLARQEASRGALARLGPGVRLGLVAAPLGAVALIAAFSVPGPWNPGGARILPKLAQALRVTDDSSRERLVFYMIAGEMAARSPVLGVGPGFYGPRFHSSFADLAEKDGSGVLLHVQNLMRGGVAEFGHNDYFQIAAELGLAGLACFLAGVAALLSGLAGVIRGGGAMREESLAILSALSAFLAVSVFSGPLHFSDRASVFWVLCGAGLACIALAAGESEAA